MNVKTQLKQVSVIISNISRQDRTYARRSINLDHGLDSFGTETLSRREGSKREFKNFIKQEHTQKTNKQTYLLSENHSFESLEICEVSSLGLDDAFLRPRGLCPFGVDVLFLPSSIKLSSLDGSFNDHFDVCE